MFYYIIISTNFKPTSNIDIIVDVVATSLFLTLNKFHALFSCFYRYFWAGKCRL